MTNKLINMMCLDIYLSSLNELELKALDLNSNFKSVGGMPLLSWDLYSDQHFHQLREFKRNQDILKIKDLAQTLNWTSDINKLFKNEKFEAIIVTDLRQNIIWVNDGFTEMTGYSKKEALHKTPQFLQGPKSCNIVKERIRIGLSGIEPFTEVISNYRKNQEIYECEVKIFPLYNDKTTHFIALEKRVI